MQSPSTARERQIDVIGESSEMALPSILTTHHKRFHPGWVKRTELLPGWYDAYERANLSHWRSLWWALQLFRESKNYDAVVTGAEHCGILFAMLQTLFRRRSQRRPHVMIDFPWAARPGRLTLALKVLQMSIAAPSIISIFAHASPEEAERFKAALRVREGLFQFVPFHHSLPDALPETRLGDYVFSGGNTGRDYATLISALGDTGHKAVICTQARSGLRNVSIPSNIQVIAVSHEKFFEMMAASAVVVVPVMKDDIHPAGHTIVVHAMALGKPIVLAAPSEYRSYIEDGRTGLLTPAGDAAQLRAAINRVVSDRNFACMLGNNARQEATRFAPEEFFARVFECIDRAIATNRGAGEIKTNGGAR